MIILRNIRFPVSPEYDLNKEIAKKLRIPFSAVRLHAIQRKAVDCRRKNQPVYDFTVVLDQEISSHLDVLPFAEPSAPSYSPIVCKDPHPYIIGMGPAGLFCALEMVKNGLKPILFDRGSRLEDRATKVATFWSGGDLDVNSNVQFGEGGAGAFSDGKLTSRGRDRDFMRVFEHLISFGADPAISYEALPHLGTDGIRAIVANIRNYLIAQGCEFRYNSTLEDMRIETGKLTSVTINGEQHTPELLILAIGNSARKTFRQLAKRGIKLEPKPFAVGFRIEHLQERINRAIYGKKTWEDILGPATYRLAHQSTYSFCMCPGGEVVAASSEEGGVVTNGMSYSSRDGKYANSAIVSVADASIYGEGLFKGVEFQEQLERQAWTKSYHAPAQELSEFLYGKRKQGDLISTYRPGVYSGNISTLLPVILTNKIKTALHKFGTTIDEFCVEAVLIAPETRTSSPIRILRDEQSLACLGTERVFAIGEGSGYSGGIVSSAADGVRLGMRSILG